MVRAVERGHEIGADALQVFSDNPATWHRRTAPPSELPAFRERLAAHGIGPVAIHAAYLVNLAGPDSNFWELSIQLLADELRNGPAFGATYVNVHTGSHRGAGVDAGTWRIADGIERSLAAAGDDPATPLVVLENSAGGGFGLGATIEELAGIAEAIAARGIDESRVGFCLDAAHAWGAGYDLSNPGVTDRLLEDFDREIGIHRLVLVHLNDSRSELGSRTDRHEHVAAGRIGEAGMAYLVCHPMLAHATYILETPGMDEGYDAINLQRVRDLAAGRPLAPLPPGALDVRSSRSRSAPPRTGDEPVA